MVARFSLLVAALGYSLVTGFSDKTSFTLFDRFQAECPADPSAIRLFDASLVDRLADNSIWVAVYRSSNNKPSVLIRDDLFSAMRSATDTRNPSPAPADVRANFVARQRRAPVAVAKLQPSAHFAGSWELSHMRCILKKEDTDEACDGGSEHTEAIATAIDALLQHFLQVCDRFEGALRTKASLVGGPILEARGFEPVDDLQPDMASHISSLDACLERYASRSVSTDAKSPGARDRAIAIVSLLGRRNREDELRAFREQQAQGDPPGEFDPWSGMKRFL